MKTGLIIILVVLGVACGGPAKRSDDQVDLKTVPAASIKRDISITENMEVIIEDQTRLVNELKHPSNSTELAKKILAKDGKGSSASCCFDVEEYGEFASDTY